MLDPATFRRLRPNYPFSQPKKDYDIVELEESEEETDVVDSSSDGSSDNMSQDDPFKEVDAEKARKKAKRERKKKFATKYVQDSEDSDCFYTIEVPNPDNVSGPQRIEKLAPEDDGQTKRVFTDEEYLIASPVVLGFSFGEKLWLEFAVSGISTIIWNEGAFDSLIIADDQKRVVRALVESHAHESKKNIDDLIQGKGRGLVAVLHGQPGTGKTLMAEGVAEFLKKPLYAVSVGELGIRGIDLENNLREILLLAQKWDALMLLDEADVFLEIRTSNDVSRNALVSIFLRTLEYFQGILFLTTNRVAVFDPAFASRIHIGLRFSDLTVPAKKKIWKLFIDRVKALPDVQVEDLSDGEINRLANFELNGREVCFLPSLSWFLTLYVLPATSNNFSALSTAEHLDESIRN